MRVLAPAPAQRLSILGPHLEPNYENLAYGCVVVGGAGVGSLGWEGLGLGGVPSPGSCSGATATECACAGTGASGASTSCNWHALRTNTHTDSPSQPPHPPILHQTTTRYVSLDNRLKMVPLFDMANHFEFCPNILKSDGVRVGAVCAGR